MKDHTEKDVNVNGDVEIGVEEAASLKLDPEYRVYKRIDEIDLEVEIQKGCTKARCHFMSDNNNHPNATQNDDDNNSDEQAGAELCQAHAQLGQLAIKVSPVEAKIQV